MLNKYSNLIDNSPLYKGLLSHIKENPDSWHMPGHKGGMATSPILQKLAPQFLKFDLTEISSLDDLHNAKTIIAQAQKKAANLMKAKAAHFLVNGTSGGLQSAVMAMCNPHEKVLLPRNAHKSIWTGLALADATPISLDIEIDQKWQIPIGLSTQTLKEALKANNDAKLLILINPSYHGLSDNIKEQIALAKSYGLKVLVDEAHGSHFAFNKNFPVAATSLNADIVVQSWHKTLGSLGQSALLLQNNLEIPIEHYLKVFQSSSPSYLLMASLDLVRSWWEAEGSNLGSELYSLAKAARQKLSNLSNIKLLPNKAFAQDISRLVIKSKYNLNGWDMAKYLEEQQIFVEMAESKSITLILTLGNNIQQINYLTKSLSNLPKTSKLNPSILVAPKSKRKISLNKALRQKSKFILLEDAQNLICSDFIAPYPPGIPILTPGEIVDSDIINYIKELISGGNQIHGLKIDDNQQVYISIINNK